MIGGTLVTGIFPATGETPSIGGLLVVVPTMGFVGGLVPGKVAMGDALFWLVTTGLLGSVAELGADGVLTVDPPLATGALVCRTRLAVIGRDAPP